MKRATATGSDPVFWKDAVRVKVPFPPRALNVGTKVLLSGNIYTARDAAHARMIQALDEGAPLPFDLDGQVIYYAGPCPPGPGQIIGSIGPTTSGRMDPYTPRLLSCGLAGMIGKGKRNRQVVAAIKEHGAVYFVAVGGIGALLSRTVEAARVVAYPELGPEAVYRLEVEEFPAIVAISSSGCDIYERGDDFGRQE